MRVRLTHVNSSHVGIVTRIIKLCTRLTQPYDLGERDNHPHSIPMEERRTPPRETEVNIEEEMSMGWFLPFSVTERKFASAYESELRDPAPADTCRHDMRGDHKDFLPGICTISCPHGFYLGFFLMVNPESVETVFTFLYSRCEDGKLIVVYDNACNLMEFCLNREPYYFKDTIFLVDRVHWDNHVNCTRGTYC